MLEFILLSPWAEQCWQNCMLELGTDLAVYHWWSLTLSRAGATLTVLGAWNQYLKTPYFIKWWNKNKNLEYNKRLTDVVEWRAGQAAACVLISGGEVDSLLVMVTAVYLRTFSNFTVEPWLTAVTFTHSMYNKTLVYFYSGIWHSWISLMSLPLTILQNL